MTSPERRGGWAGWLEELEEELEGTVAGSCRDRIADRILDKARLRRADSVVDLGSGHGLLAVKAAGIVGPQGRVVAVDCEPGCLEEIQRRSDIINAGNVFPTLGRLEDLPFTLGEFDAAVCRSALGYTPDLDKAVGEISRVLVAGGRFSVFEPLPGEMTWSVSGGDPLKDFLGLDRILLEEREPGPLDRLELRRAFAGAGFAFESLVVHYEVALRGRKPEEIVGEYLYDLPEELSAKRVLGRRFAAQEVVRIVSGFACAASAGEISGRLPCMFIWGTRAP